jgi:hypothetical protein
VTSVLVAAAAAVARVRPVGFGMFRVAGRSRRRGVLAVGRVPTVPTDRVRRAVTVAVVGRHVRGVVRHAWFVGTMVPSAPEEVHPTPKAVNVSSLGERCEVRPPPGAMETRKPNDEQALRF